MLRLEGADNQAFTQAAGGKRKSKALSVIQLHLGGGFQQQESLGILGVNVIYGAFYLHHDPVALIQSFVNDLSTKRVEVDMVKLTGPAFRNVDSRIMSLELVRLGLADSAMFTPVARSCSLS